MWHYWDTWQHSADRNRVENYGMMTYWPYWPRGHRFHRVPRFKKKTVNLIWVALDLWRMLQCLFFWDWTQGCQSFIPSLKLTFSPLKMDGWNTIFLLGRPIFRGYVSFREGNLSYMVSVAAVVLADYSDGVQTQHPAGKQAISPGRRSTCGTHVQLDIVCAVPRFNLANLQFW